MNKSELIDAIAKHADISKAAAGRALDATVNSIGGSLKKGEIVTWWASDRFTSENEPRDRVATRERARRSTIKAAKVPKFRAGKALKDSVN